MPTHPAVLLTIIAEGSLESPLQELVKQAGAEGYTLEDITSGWGSHGRRYGHIESDRTLKMLLIATPAVIDTVMKELERTMLPHYAIVAFRHDVDALMRPRPSDGNPERTS